MKTKIFGAVLSFTVSFSAYSSDVAEIKDVDLKVKKTRATDLFYENMMRLSAQPMSKVESCTFDGTHVSRYDVADSISMHNRNIQGLIAVEKQIKELEGKSSEWVESAREIYRPYIGQAMQDQADSLFIRNMIAQCKDELEDQVTEDFGQDEEPIVTSAMLPLVMDVDSSIPDSEDQQIFRRRLIPQLATYLEHEPTPLELLLLNEAIFRFGEGQFDLAKRLANVLNNIVLEAEFEEEGCLVNGNELDRDLAAYDDSHVWNVHRQEIFKVQSEILSSLLKSGYEEGQTLATTVESMVTYMNSEVDYNRMVMQYSRCSSRLDDK
jgi:hypothetical protein